MADREEEYKKLRSYLNKSIRGKNTDAILKSVASGPVHLINNIEAVNDSLYIVSAAGNFLDEKLSDRGVIRPASVGLSDEVFKKIGIEISNRKQIRTLIHELLRIFYGDIYTRATSKSLESETYFLEDGDNLILSFDDEEEVEITFSEGQFNNINFATAQEVADAITRLIRKSGRTGAAFAEEENGNTKVVLISSTDGPSSSIKVLGGKAQSSLKFDTIRATAAESSTEWVITREDNGNVRFTYNSGANPRLGSVSSGDYVNIFGNNFGIEDQGTFDVVEVGADYFEIINPPGLAMGDYTTLQGDDEAILFFKATKKTLNTNLGYAAAYQTSPRTLEVFMPATTRVVERKRIGAAHLHLTNAPSAENEPGPYCYDLSTGFTLGKESATTEFDLDSSSESIIKTIDDVSDFPDEEGHLIIGFGTSRQEGPIPYIARPSDTTLRINPSYKIQNFHPAGTDIALISQSISPSPDKDGTDYPFFVTDSPVGRIYAEDLINQITATGITLIVYILYPNDIGLGNWGDEENSEKYYIWGDEGDL